MKKFYSFRDAEMLMAASVVAENFKKNINQLSKLRNNWTPEYADDLIGRINSAIDTNLKKDYRSDLREATVELLNIHQPALRSLASFRMQVQIDFPEEESKILRKLGLTSGYSAARKTNSQEKLFQVLAMFNQGMSESLKKKLVAKGMNAELVEEILNYADRYKRANAKQENLKQASLKISRDVRVLFNDLYAEVVGICKIAYATFFNDPVLRDHFSFSQIVRNMSSGQHSATRQDETINEEEDVAVL